MNSTMSARNSGTTPVAVSNSDTETSRASETNKPNFVQVRRDRYTHRWQLLDKLSNHLTQIKVGVMKNVSYATTEEPVPDGCTPGEHQGLASGLLLSQNDPEYKEAINRIFDARHVEYEKKGKNGYFHDNITRSPIRSAKYLVLLEDGSAFHILH